MPSRSSAVANCLLWGWTEQGRCSGLRVRRQMRHAHINVARTPSENVCGQPHLTAQPCTHVPMQCHKAMHIHVHGCADSHTHAACHTSLHVEMLPQLHKHGVTGTPKLPVQCSAACVSSQSHQIPFWCNYTPVRQHRWIYPSISWMSCVVTCSEQEKTCGKSILLPAGRG